MIIDLHQDIFYQADFPDHFDDKTTQTSIDILRSLGKTLVLGTGFAEIKGDITDWRNEIEKDIDRYEKEVESGNLDIILKKEDLVAFKENNNPLAVILHIEGFYSDKDNVIDNLNYLFDRGMRSLGLTWNLDNGICGNCTSTTGLTDIGRKVIRWANEKSVLIDLSHSNSQSVIDSIETSSRPIFLSHGASRTLCDRDRNFTDDVLIKVANGGGVVGIFAATNFLSNSRTADFSAFVNQLKYIKNICGEDSVALGSDFGGILSKTIPELSSANDLIGLNELLKKEQFGDSFLEKFLHKNAYRFLVDSL